jgi:hypothetical protein
MHFMDAWQARIQDMKASDPPVGGSLAFMLNKPS